MVTIKLTIDKRRIKKDGSYPLIFKLSTKGSSRDIPTGYSSKESDWNNRTNNIKETHPLIDVIAPRIKELELLYLSKIIEFNKQYPNENKVQTIKEYILNAPKQELTVYSFWVEEIKLLNKTNRNGGAIVYQLSLNAINKLRNLNISFDKINYDFLKQLEADFIQNGLNINSVGVHFRALRAIFNKAINSKLVSINYYPFKAFKIRKQATSPRVFSLLELRNYFLLEIKNDFWLYDSWMLGKLMFMLIGINFNDLIKLTKNNIKANRVVYTRSKTKKIYSIKLLAEALEIINYFEQKSWFNLFGLTENQINDRVKLPIIIHQKNKVFNHHLDKIGKMINSKEKLTGYVFRYTWANIAKQLGYSKDLIAEALGHEYGNQVTGIYLEAYDKELVDEMNQTIINKIMSKE